MAEGRPECRQRDVSHADAVGKGHSGGFEGVRTLFEHLPGALGDLGIELRVGPSKDTGGKGGSWALQSAPLKRGNPRHILVCDWPEAMACLDRGLFSRKIPVLALKLAATAVGGVRQKIPRYVLGGGSATDV